MPIKFEGSYKKDSLEYEYYENKANEHIGDEYLMAIKIDFETKFAEIRDKNNNSIEKIYFNQEIMENSIISFQKDPSEK